MTQQTETRGPGRPATFPNVETCKLSGARVPVATREQLQEIVQLREIPVAQALATAIERFHRDVTRSRKRSRKATPAATENAG